MAMKQTAVDWFAEQIIRKYPLIAQYLPNYNFDKEIIEQAKAMEKEQIKDAHECGYTEGILHSCESGEEYYNKTFKSE